MLPENLKTASKEFIDELIASNLNSLYSKYRDAGYVLLEPIVFRRSHGFQYNEVLTFEKLQSVIPHYEVATDGRFSDEDGIEHVITKVSFYNLSQNEIETILQQRHYDISDLRLLTWNTEEGSVEYRVAYVLEY
ncbi:MAG: hypothetical protein H6767_01460 [Candidatus Peribacteria bacterium]|nr:MAG: hypothetical protein H6767_01460 [Candidatus Peribacteria bacterium]